MFILMVMVLLILTLAVATVLIAYRLGIRYNPQPIHSLAAPAAAVKTSRSETTQWRSVKIKSGLICCKSAGKLNGTVFFAADAPTLPLAACTEKQCQCKYTHLEDRRQEDDRREATEYSVDLFSLTGKERRTSEDRRTITD